MNFLKRFEDLRFVIGLFFGIVAILLVVASLTQQGPEVGVNSRVAALMGIFSAGMLVMSFLGAGDLGNEG